MREVMFVFLVFILISLSGCNTTVNEKITQEKALKIVEEYVLSKNLDFEVFTEYNGVEIVEEKTYLVIHAYTIGADFTYENGEEGNLSFTYAWYYVDELTGMLFKDDLMGEEGPNLILQE